MQGLKLAREFYQVCQPMLRADLAGIMDTAAVGLVGEGSECFGCDDAQSQDHDFGPAFCLWLPREVLLAEQPRIEAAFAKLPHEFNGFASRLAPQSRQGRVGPLPIEDFYAFFTGLDHAPATWQEWLAIPEYQLAACTNGEVFEDTGGACTRWRTALLACYPRDVLLKKMTARCMVMAQAGQYNLPRSLQRNDPVAAMLAAARFAEAALSFVFLCNRPFTNGRPNWLAICLFLARRPCRRCACLRSPPCRAIRPARLWPLLRIFAPMRQIICVRWV